MTHQITFPSRLKSGEKSGLGTKSAVSLGLIVNELVTNSLKYAYPACDGGVLRIGLSRSGGTATLSVEDEGCGMPESFDPEQATSMGIRLVKLLAEQIGGKITIRSDSGVATSVSFPYS
jgi:two-component sensor histidine kinase